MSECIITYEDNHKGCVKCGVNFDREKTPHVTPTRRYVEGKDILMWTCPACGYEWPTGCKDGS